MLTTIMLRLPLQQLLHIINGVVVVHMLCCRPASVVAPTYGGEHSPCVSRSLQCLRWTAICHDTGVDIALHSSATYKHLVIEAISHPSPQIAAMVLLGQALCNSQ